MFRHVTSPPRIAGVLALGLAAACSSEPTSPGPRPTSPAEVAEHAFLLTIDVPTGRVTVGAPGGDSRGAAARVAGGPSFSLIGSDAVRLNASNCTFSSIPNNSKLKSCSMTLAIENQLSATDLLPPTAFPNPPAGSSGILVFPYTAAGLGVPGGSAVPNALWDGAPANFFNDFSGCASGKGSDCYRWEGFASPLRAGQTSAARTVGFDVDKNANTVAAFIVVAADLRDNPIQTVNILPEPDNCSYHSRGDPNEHINPDHLSVGNIVDFRSLCSFVLPGIPAGVDILSATLRVFRIEAGGPIENITPVIVDHMDYGPSIELSEWTGEALTENIGNFPIAIDPAFQTLDVLPEVTADLTASRTRSQYRFRVFQAVGEGAGVRFAGPSTGAAPQLTITYRKR